MEVVGVFVVGSTCDFADLSPQDHAFPGLLSQVDHGYTGGDR